MLARNTNRLALVIFDNISARRLPVLKAGKTRRNHIEKHNCFICSIDGISGNLFSCTDIRSGGDAGAKLFGRFFDPLYALPVVYGNRDYVLV